MQPTVISETLRRLAMALLMLSHIQIAAFVIGGLVIAVAAQSGALLALHSQNYLKRLGRSLAFTVVVVYSSGAVLAIIFVLLISQLWPSVWYSLMRVNRWPMLLEAITFALTIAFIFPYWYLWKRLAAFPAVHLALGVAGVAVVHLQQSMIDIMAGYMLTNAPPENFLRVFLNPTAIPLDMHRTVGNISFAGFLLAAYAAVRTLRSKGEESRAYHDWLGELGLLIGLGFLFLQPAIGVFYMEEIRWHSSGAFNSMMRGRLSWVFLGQALLFSSILFLAVLYLTRQADGVSKRMTRILRLLLVLNTLGGLLLIQPYVIGPSQYTFWIRWTNPIGSMQPFKYIAFAVQSISSFAAVLVYLGGGIRTTRRTYSFQTNRGAQKVLFSLGCTASLMMLVMGYIRESSRLPFSIYGVQRIDSPMKLPALPKSGENH